MSTQAFGPTIEAVTDDPLAVLLEIGGQEVGYQSAGADGAGKTFHHTTAILKPAGRYFARIEFLGLEGQVVVAYLLDRGPLSGYSQSGLAAGVQVCGDAEVVVVRCLRVFPYAEEVHLASDLLASLTVVVRGQGKGRVGLGRLLSAPAC
ncbi:MAG: hypothetical protein WBD75_05800 [Phycisphaerae bacterium]